MNKEKLTKSIYKWAYWYFIIAITPAGLFLAAYDTYLYINYPEQFSYQCPQCPQQNQEQEYMFNIGCSDIYNITTIYTGTYYPQVINDPDECEEREKETAAYNNRVILCLVIAAGYLFFDFLHKRGKL